MTSASPTTPSSSTPPDNGAEKLTWPDGGTTPSFGEKGTTLEGGSLCVRWPGTIKPGTVYNNMVYNNIMSHEDWMPTLAAAAGDPDVVKKVAEGYKVGDKTVKQHLDGYNFVPFFQGEEQQSPRHEIFYFDQTGNLNAVRYDDWKVASIPPIESRRLGRSLSISGPSPFESAPHDSGMYVWWYADLLWLFVPIQGKIAEFGATLKEYPPVTGGSLSGGLNYKAVQIQNALDQLESLSTYATDPSDQSPSACHSCMPMGFLRLGA